MNNISQLAQLMNVSESDVMDHAQLIINELNRDGVAKFFKECDDETGAAMVQAYSRAAVKTLKKMTTAYMTNPEVRNWTQDAVLANLKGA